MISELRFHLQNHAKLIELGENDGDLPLPECVVKRVVDGLGEDIEARGFFPIHIDVQLQAVDLLIAGHVAELRQLRKFLHQFRRPLGQLGSASASCKMYWY